MSSQGRGRQVFTVLFALNFVLSTTGGFAYPAKENTMTEPLALPVSDYALVPPSETSDKPRNCYHFYVSRNMSSLLSDATKMLRQVHDKREREWILTFIYRIKSLAEHLRSHPESQNYEECMSVEDDDTQKRKTSILSETLRIPQPELYFVDDMSPNQKRFVSESEGAKESDAEIADEQSPPDVPKQDSNDNPASTEWKEQSMSNLPSQKDAENFNSVAESTSESLSLKKDGQHPSDSAPTAAGADSAQLKDASRESYGTDDQEGKGQDDSDIIVSSPEPECQSEVKCSEVVEQGGDNAQEVDEAGQQDDVLVQQLHARRKEWNAELDRKHQILLKERIRKALLEDMAPEVKKLRTVGGTQDDLIDLWKQSEKEIEKEEAQKRRDNDFDYEEIGAAAGDLNSNDKFPQNYRTVAPSSDQVGNYKKQSEEQPYVHNDVLVQQLYDARDEEPQYRPTRSLNDPKDEYLIISTHIP